MCYCYGDKVRVRVRPGFGRCATAMVLWVLVMLRKIGIAIVQGSSVLHQASVMMLHTDSIAAGVRGPFSYHLQRSGERVRFRIRVRLILEPPAEDRGAG